jgi:hypothetical protein
VVLGVTDPPLSHLHLTQPASDDLQPDDSPPTLEMMLEDVPLGIEIAVDLDDLHDPADPCLTDSGRRFCIATRRAGGRSSRRGESEGKEAPRAGTQRRRNRAAGGAGGTRGDRGDGA